MQRTTNPLPKHPSYGNRPTPTLQLLSKLAKFNGERKDIIGRTPKDIIELVKGNESVPNSPSPNVTQAVGSDLMREYEQRRAEKEEENQLKEEFQKLMDPNYKPADPEANKELKSHRYTYNSHLNSNVGKLFSPENDQQSEVQEWTSQSKRMVGPKISNFNNSVIGGQAPSGDPWQTTTQCMNNGEDPLNKKNANRKKLINRFEPEQFVSPITGEQIANYGSWAEEYKNGNQPKPKNQEEEDEQEKLIDDPVLQKLKTQLSSRGAKGIIGLGRLFRIMDDDRSNTLSFSEFKKAMREFGMNLNDTETILLFKRFDKSNTGAVSYNDFLSTLAGALNKRRARLVNMAFDVLDQDGSGVVELADIAGAYNCSKHPDVLSGKKTKDQVLLEFLDNFDVGGTKDGKVTREEFQNYYSTISSSIDRDDYFELMIRNAWHLSGGEGSAANTANKRVLVTKSDGTQEVVEIKKDLGLNIKDTQEVIRRLKAQGVDAVNVASFDSSDNQDPAKKSRPQTAGSRLAGTRGKPSDKEIDKNNPMNIPSAGIKLLIEKVKKAMKIRGVNSFNDLQKRFKIMDDDHSLSLSYAEFKKALKELSSLSDLTEGDLRCLFSYFDKDSSGSIDFNEFISGIRDPMNERRLALVKKAFDRLDSDKSGVIELNDIINVYDTSKHPEVIAKRKTKNQVLTEFLANFEVDGTIDGKVSYEEFVNYYHNISASIDNDNYFELMICNAWHINPNETDKTANRINTANLRVMVTNSEGREEVIMLENDLGINESNKNDIKLLYARLRSQGVNDIYAINGKIIKVVNINGVDIITTIGETSTLKDDVSVKKAAAPSQSVLKAPPFRRPQSANAIPMHGNNYQPIAGVPEVAVKPNNAYGNNKPVVINAVDTNPVKSSSNRIDKNTQLMANTILNNLNKRKVIHEKIKEENIVGNTLLDVLKVQLLSKGVQGIVDLQRKFSEIDRNQNSFIDLEEFTAAIKELNLIFSNDQIENLFNYLDHDGSGGIDYFELLQGLRGPINPKLLVLIHQIFDKLDVDQRNMITPQQLISGFRPNRHPEVMSGDKTDQEILQEFLDSFDVGSQYEGMVTRDEFVQYFHNTNMVVNDEVYMELILRRVWGMSESDNNTINIPYRVNANGNGNLNNSSNSSVKGRIQTAKAFGSENWNSNTNRNDANNLRRPSSASATGRRPSNPAAPSNVPISLEGVSIQSLQPPTQGDQSVPQYRPHSASVTPRGYKLMGNNEAAASQRPQQGTGIDGNQIESKLADMKREAVVLFNNSQYEEALRLFQQIKQYCDLVFPSNHPECDKANKSIQLTQRKIQQMNARR